MLLVKCGQDLSYEKLGLVHCMGTFTTRHAAAGDLKRGTEPCVCGGVTGGEEEGATLGLRKQKGGDKGKVT